MVERKRTGASGGVMMAWPLALVFVEPPALPSVVSHRTALFTCTTPAVSVTVTVGGAAVVMATAVQPGMTQGEGVPASGVSSIVAEKVAEPAGKVTCATLFASVVGQMSALPPVLVHSIPT